MTTKEELKSKSVMKRRKNENVSDSIYKALHAGELLLNILLAILGVAAVAVIFAIIMIIM